MRRIILITIIITVCLKSSLVANNSFLLNGDTLHVWAKGGLFLRDTSNINGIKKTLIPYGAQIKFIRYANYEIREEIIFFKKGKYNKPDYDNDLKCLEYKQKGSWYKVNYNNIIGYVFSGYTSRFIAPENPDNIFTGKYIEDNYKMLDKKEKQGNQFQVSFSTYEKGISIYSYAEKVGYEKYLFPNMTLEEAVLLIRNELKKMKANQEICLTHYYQNENKTIQILEFYTIENNLIKVNYISGSVLIEIESWC